MVALPSLKGLQAFEAAARTGSFAAAAEELSVSAAAVSQLIRTVEEQIGRKLFHRVNQQDFEACERCQPAMDSRTYRDGGVLVPSEHHIGAFHDWLKATISQ